MYQIKERDLEKIKALFEYYLHRYDEVSERFKDLKYTEVKYSDVYIDFYPFQSERISQKAGVFYKKTPKNIESTITNILIENKIYYCYNTKNKLWGERFYIYEEERILYLCYTINHFTDKMELDMIYSMEFTGSHIDKTYFFGKDRALGSSCSVYTYEYTDEKITKFYLYEYWFDQKKWLYIGFYKIVYLAQKYSIYFTKIDEKGNEIEERVYYK
ncbi:hypothetical protein ACIRNY_09375 [Capnocytophaga canimorsus]|uniref:hypothetical protein n=1 Tax=Capnocytophaga canimorsus TaxID=28188 RepID=UPI00384AEF07